MRLIKRRFYIINGFTIEAIGKSTIKKIISINNIVKIKRIIYILNCNFNFILLS